MVKWTSADLVKCLFLKLAVRVCRSLIWILCFFMIWRATLLYLISSPIFRPASPWGMSVVVAKMSLAFDFLSLRTSFSRLILYCLSGTDIVPFTLSRLP